LFCGNSLSSLSVYTQHNSTSLADKLAEEEESLSIV